MATIHIHNVVSTLNHIGGLQICRHLQTCCYPFCCFELIGIVTFVSQNLGKLENMGQFAMWHVEGQAMRQISLSLEVSPSLRKQL